MPELLLIRWRDIPAQVIVREGRLSEKRELPERFVQAIDRAAMRAGLRESDAYLGEWRRDADAALLAEVAAAVPEGTSLATLADRAQALLDARYDDQRLAALSRNDGRA
jgi:hypothetical protein